MLSSNRHRCRRSNKRRNHGTRVVEGAVGPEDKAADAVFSTGN